MRHGAANLLWSVSVLCVLLLTTIAVWKRGEISPSTFNVSTTKQLEDAYVAASQEYPSFVLNETTASGVPNVRYITYGDGCCKIATARACEAAAKFASHSSCAIYNRNVMDEKFQAKNAAILQQARGAGYWLWKPYIIHKALSESTSALDVIIYADAGIYATRSLEPLVEAARRDPNGVLVFGLCQHKMGKYTKRDAFALLGADRFRDRYQMLASIVVVRPTQVANEFVLRWLTACQDPRAITDAPNTLGQPNFPEFVDHRHDQSLLSLVAMGMGIDAYRDPTQFGEPSLCGNMQHAPLANASDHVITAAFFNHDRLRN